MYYLFSGMFYLFVIGFDKEDAMGMYRTNT